MTQPKIDSPGQQDGQRRRGLGWVAAPAIIFAALTTMFALALTSGDPQKLPSALIGKPVPQTTFAPLEGHTVGGQPALGFASADFPKGEVAVVNFWASWCVPCVTEHPNLVALAEKTGVAIYGVNYKDDATAARRFLSRYGNPYKMVGTDKLGRGAIEWGVYGMPETFVVDGRGRIAYKHVGPITELSLRQDVIPAVEAARAGSSAAR
ncbi:MAG: DsbE family thiol:disulfide interchange protein [Hyphomicrobiaceae bacterium]|nr:DsbE family thiol:disulfide interchange protein [Hyphomicrobiaceae bacterium]